MLTYNRWAKRLKVSLGLTLNSHVLQKLIMTLTIETGLDDPLLHLRTQNNTDIMVTVDLGSNY